MLHLITSCLIISFLTGCASLSGAPSPIMGTHPLGQSQARAPVQQSNCPTAAHRSGILVDGDFSQTTDPGGTFVTYAKGSTFAPAWQVKKHTVDLVGSTYWNMDGLCSVDLDGQSAVGGIAHAGFPTRRGAAYTVRFLLSGNGFCSPTVKTMKVRAGNQSTTLTWDTSNENDIQHGSVAEESWEFRARGPMTDLSLTSLDPRRSGCGPVVAALSIARR
jgi:hypothetical protein